MTLFPSFDFCVDRILCASAALAAAVYPTILVMGRFGLWNEQLHDYNSMHFKMAIAWSVMFLVDFSDFYTGWKAWYVSILNPFSHVY